jgi:sugar phosphate isomerase/epimerase
LHPFGLLRHCVGMKRALLSLAALASTAIAGDFNGEAGLQLYSLRDIFKPDPAAALDKTKGYGLKFVETYNTPTPAPVELRKMLDERGLKAVSGHFGYEMYDKDIAKVVESAKALGFEYVGIAWIPHVPALFGMDSTEKAVADFNKWGEELAKHGLKLFYHCHGYEFKPVAEGATKTFMDVLIEKTNPKFVTFEMDVFWVVFPGADPVQYLTNYPGRWQLMHLKDISKSARTGIFTGKTSTEYDVVLGTGQVNWRAVLSAAAKSGVKHYFIEDENPKAATQIPESLKYLQTLK